MTLLALRMGLSLPFFLALGWADQRRRQPVPLAGRDWGLMLGLGFSGYYLASYLDFLGLQYISAALERLILFAYPTLVWWTKDGKMEGFKLYAIRPGSVVALLGLSNGDTVHEINGFPLSSVEETLQVLAKVRAASSLELTMTRRGQPLSLRYSIQ